MKNQQLSDQETLIFIPSKDQCDRSLGVNNQACARAYSITFRKNIASDHASRADDGAFPDSGSAQNERACANPDTVLNNDRFGIAGAGGSRPCSRELVASGDDTYARSDIAIAADAD